jgi:hypothetical protein
MTDSTEISAEKIEKQIRLIWKNLSDLNTIYANQLLISHSGGEFYLIFGEFLAAEIDVENPPNTAIIKPVAKIAISPRAMQRMANIITENVSKFKDRVEKGYIDSDGSTG